eukprot:Sspe_Gene.26632::Locus_11166_Transcript_1_1_Confidence_1.000_Length_760::g.26632::m.26632
MRDAAAIAVFSLMILGFVVVVLIVLRQHDKSMPARLLAGRLLSDSRSAGQLPSQLASPPCRCLESHQKDLRYSTARESGTPDTSEIHPLSPALLYYSRPDFDYSKLNLYTWRMKESRMSQREHLSSTL